MSANNQFSNLTPKGTPVVQLQEWTGVLTYLNQKLNQLFTSFFVTAVTATLPVVSTGGFTPNISVNNATATNSGLVPTPPNNTYEFLRADATWAIASPLVVVLAYVQPNGTPGGSSTNGGWQVYPINTIVQNDLAIAAISSNTWVLPAGTYEIIGGGGIILSGDNFAFRLDNVTLSTVLAVSLNGFAASSDTNIQGYTSFLCGSKFVLATTTTLRMDYWVVTSKATNGLGANNSITAATEQYGYIALAKVA